jgi:hypothetical protein
MIFFVRKRDSSFNNTCMWYGGTKGKERRAKRDIGLWEDNDE